jgi:anti-anti-sigma factor
MLTRMTDTRDGGESASVDAGGIRPPPAFTVVAGEPRGGVAIVRLEGEMDLAATETVRAVVDGARGHALIFDLERVTFVDSAILKELLRARAELAGRGVRLVLAGAPRTVRRLMELTRTADLFETARDVAAAERQVAG